MCNLFLTMFLLCLFVAAMTNMKIDVCFFIILVFPIVVIVVGNGWLLPLTCVVKFDK